jgi:hypothetical protein
MSFRIYRYSFLILIIIIETSNVKAIFPDIALQKQIITNIHSEPDFNELCRAFGYLKGQQYSLDKIQTKFPELRLNVKRCETEFFLVFGKAAERITSSLKEQMGTKFQEFDKLLMEQVSGLLKDENFSFDVSVNFLEEVMERTKGEIESPVLEVLLFYQFFDNPSMEYLKGFVKKYSTKGHSKAKGINLMVKLPKSWSQSEGERPNIVQKFRSENGKGDASIMIMVKDIDLPEGINLTKEEINQMFSSDTEMKSMVPEDGQYIYGKKIYLDNLVGAEISMKTTRQRLDYTMTMQTVQFITIYKNKFVMCQCIVSAQNENGLNERFNKFLPIFRMVANSMVFMDQY